MLGNMNLKSNKKILEIAIKLLKQIEQNGFSAYIVGGFVRDLQMKVASTDIDITTSATPKEIREIFGENCLPNDEYGSIKVIFQGVNFEITTYRKEITYKDHRKPVEFQYIDTLEEDLQRRDFIINTICMNSNGKIVDLLGAQKDIREKIIHTVGNANQKFSEDVLRILRAIRFATVLNFKLSEEVKEAILLNKYLLKNLSYDRKKKELDKIFTSKNVKYGVKMLTEFGLDQYLEIPNLKSVTYFGDILGTWALLDANQYPFTKNEREMIDDIKEAMTMDLKDPFTLYHYDPYVSMIVADMKGISKREITKRYNHLPIKSIKDLEIDGNEIKQILGIEGGPLIKNILDNLEYEVLYSKLKNKKSELKKYVVKHYKT